MLNSRLLGDYMLTKLEEIKQRHPSVGDVRGKGLFAAIELVKDRATREPVVPWTVKAYEGKDPLMTKLISELKEKGLYAYTRWNIILICPPLSITKDELTWGLDQIDSVLSLADEYICKPNP